MWIQRVETGSSAVASSVLNHYVISPALLCLLLGLEKVSEIRNKGARITAKAERVLLR